MKNQLRYSEIAPIASQSSRAQFKKSIDDLQRIIERIALDRAINGAEVEFLISWLKSHAGVATRHPYNEIIPLITTSLKDGRISEEDLLDIYWLCEQLRSAEFTYSISASFQRLHAIVNTVTDGSEVDDAGRFELARWLREHEPLNKCWPYDEIDGLVTNVLRTGNIHDNEHAVLKSYFSEFVNKLDDQALRSPTLDEGQSIADLYTVCPKIVFEGSTFCFAGVSVKYSRDDLLMLVCQFGGCGVVAMSPMVDYLVIAGQRNPCWAYSCYGRKVEEAVQLRESGVRVGVVHEDAFHDAIAEVL